MPLRPDFEPIGGVHDGSPGARTSPRSVAPDSKLGAAVGDSARDRLLRAGIDAR